MTTADDGYSGTQFDRPGFQRLLRDIEKGRINCVIVKDLSRLGRNSARTSELLEEYFPRHGVRCIAVSEGYDSLALSGGMAVAAPFLLVMNELYARDISQKIRASLRAKMEKGDFISPFAPYGYRKDPGNRNRLLVDEEAAAVVRSIFRLAADGRRPGEIAELLNGLEIPTPAAYRRLRQPGSAPDDGCGRRWSSSMLCKLLRNGVYLGQLEQGKTSKLSFKSRETQVKRRGDWIVVPNTHEALVSRVLFEQVQRRTAARRCAPTGEFINAFTGLVFCADCGKRMTAAAPRGKDGSPMLCCGGYKAHGAKACSNHFLPYAQLCELVREELRLLLHMSDDERKAVLLAAERDLSAQLQTDGQRLEAVLREKEKRLRDIHTLIRGAFEQCARGAQSEQTCALLVRGYEEERAALEGSIALLRERLSAAQEKRDLRGELAAELDSLEALEPLQSDLLRHLIERIEVGQACCEAGADGSSFRRRSIRIVYRFRDPEEKTP